MKFRVFVSVQLKSTGEKIWNKVSMTLEGDSRNMEDVMREFKLVKSDVNSDMQRKGIPFKSVDIFIDFGFDGFD